LQPTNPPRSGRRLEPCLPEIFEQRTEHEAWTDGICAASSRLFFRVVVEGLMSTWERLSYESAEICPRLSANRLGLISQARPEIAPT
jgi:hypothetical protein